MPDININAAMFAPAAHSASLHLTPAQQDIRSAFLQRHARQYRDAGRYLTVTSSGDVLLPVEFSQLRREGPRSLR